VILRARDRTLDLSAGPLLMGIVNASRDSFSGGDADPVAAARVALQAGADMVDVGGESARTDRPALTPEEEIARVVPAIERIAGELGAPVSVDTYKPAVAEAALAAGASMVNDVSGLRDPRLAEVCAAAGAALVVTHTVGAPKEKVLDHAYHDVAAEVAAFLGEKLELARAHGVEAERLVVDPGPDFGKSPAQTVAVLRGLPAVLALGRPVLLAVSRKDFVGALTGRRPRERLAGTLAAVGYGVDAGAHLLRVHDVAAAADYLKVRAALRGETGAPDDLRLPEHLRREE
jgi:dihydropteroate synthase